MFRNLKVVEDKPIQILKASEVMTRGMAVTIDYVNDEVNKATGAVDLYIVDVAPNYEGINAIITPTDGSFETIAANDKVLVIPTYVGEEYATTELTIGTLTKGAYLKASAGKFIAGAATNVCEWVYGGTYSDPSATTMYIVKRVAPHTIPNA